METRGDADEVFEVKPGRGIGPIDLGTDRDATKRHLETLFCSRWCYDDGATTDYYADNALQVTSNPVGEIVHIEASEPLKVRLAGESVLALPARQAVRATSRILGMRAIEQSDGHSYLYAGANLCLWRNTTAQDRFDTIAVAAPGVWET